ncbi:MAG: hypothetical protein CMH49_02275 [Myxococcales bacterium]|nr:hypothetical protein [Myxococcales bacterium]
MIASLRRLLIFVLIVTLPIWMSALVWYCQPTLPLKLSLVDYTVPYDNYAEHSASIWAFNHLKLIPPPLSTASRKKEQQEGSDHNERRVKELKGSDFQLDHTQANGQKGPWITREHYTGPEPFKPYIQQRLSHTYSLEYLKQNHKLPYDLIYIADTYGVYREDFTQVIEKDGKKIKVSASSDPELLKTLFDEDEIDVHMDFSKLIFGGLSESDLDVLETHAQREGDIFFEFNAFCDPTPPAVRRRAENLVGLNWTGWSGRFLPDPHDKNDAPHWLERLYKKQFPNRALPTKASLLLAHRDGRVFLIESDTSAQDVLPTLHVKSKFKDRFPMANTPYYYFWFAIMETQKTTSKLNQTINKSQKTEVLAEIHLHAPEKLKNIYEALDIPNEIPLLTESIVGHSHRFHLSIDGSDIRDNLGNYSYSGLSFLNSISRKNRGFSVNQRQVFWQFYLPMLRTVLWERSQARYADFPKSFWQRTFETLNSKKVQFFTASERKD